MKKALILLFSIFCISVAGCSVGHSPLKTPKCRVVTEIMIQTENVPEPGQCRYTDPKKMTKALNCLRRLDHWETPDTEPESVPGARYRIVLTFSDGSSKSYEQIGYSYLREESGPWQEISSQHPLRIPLLLAAVPSDAI